MKQPDKFAPPGITSTVALTDGRLAGDYTSKYSFVCWCQISVELIYLVLILASSLLLLTHIGLATAIGTPYKLLPSLLGDFAQNSVVYTWAATALAGAAGGATSALKWLYHSVAKQMWHRDRVIWRLVVPPISSVLSVFAGLMIVSGIIPLLNNTQLSNPAAGAAFGFFVGLFSDNMLAALQKLAFQWFGTAGDNRETKTD